MYDNDKPQRLAKFLAAANLASRRTCEELIFQGRVSVNGTVTLVPQTLVTEKDSITFEGREVKTASNKVYYMLNKPSGYVCTNAKDKHSRIVLDLFNTTQDRLFTVGRLDKITTGLLLVTNDGDFANSVIHPSSGIHKEYLIKTDEEISHTHLVALSQGTHVQGIFIKPVRVVKVRRNTLKIVVIEGKKHEVRLMIQAAGLSLRQLTRIRIGNLRLGELPVGSFRPLTDKEKSLIFQH